MRVLDIPHPLDRDERLNVLLGEEQYCQVAAFILTQCQSHLDADLVEPLSRIEFQSFVLDSLKVSNPSFSITPELAIPWRLLVLAIVSNMLGQDRLILLDLKKRISIMPGAMEELG